MSTYIALLRGINVGGRGMISMSDLRDFLSSLDLQEVRTLLQSGNVVFRSGARSTAVLEKQLETEVAKRFQHQVDFFVRDPADWKKMIANNPFPKEAVAQPGFLVAMLFKHEPKTSDIAALKSAVRGDEKFRVMGREAFIFYPQGQGQSKFTNAIIERRLGLRGTIRNWNTIQKLVTLADVS